MDSNKTKLQAHVFGAEEVSRALERMATIYNRWTAENNSIYGSGFAFNRKMLPFNRGFSTACVTVCDISGRIITYHTTNFCDDLPCRDET